jgi:peptidoglycan lytic transglycosylase
VKTRFNARGGRLRVAVLAAGFMTSGTAYAATAPPAEDSAAGVTISGAGKVHEVRYGQRIALNGRAAGGGEIRLQHAPAGRDWRPVASSRAGADGSYTFSVRARRSGAYRAVAGSKASAPHRVRVIARLSGKASRHVNIGRAVRVRGALKPGLGGRTVGLQLRSGGRWKTVDRTRTGRAGRFSASWHASRAGSYRLRVRFRGDRNNAAVSRTLRGRVYAYRAGGASWYGPGFYGGRTACGYTLNASIKGVANKSLPCGTRVRFRYHGRTTVAKVIDRGPYAAGREWDLTPATKRALGFGSTGTVWSTR